MIEIKHEIVYGELTSTLNMRLREGWEIEYSFAQYDQSKGMMITLYMLKREVKTEP